MTLHSPTAPFTNVSNSSVNISLDATNVPPWSTLEKAIFGSWLSISMLAAIFGNLMVVVVVARHKGMQTRTNMFLVNLAIADFLVGTVLAPFSLTTLIHETWIFGHTMCNINGFMNNVCFITSIHTLMYISIHKYVSISRPFSRVLNNCKIIVLIACAWLWSVVCAILTMFVLNKVVYKPRTMQCGPEYPHNRAEYLHHVIIQTTNILLPLLIMSVVYSRMYCEFRRHAVRLHKNTTLQSDQIIGQQIRVIKTLFIVLACFMLCWLPYVAYSTYVSMLKDKSQIPGWTNALAYCCMYMNSGCNPIIYAWRSPSFREGYKEILCQEPSYIVSDGTIVTKYKDTMRDSSSIINRLSNILHSSFRSTAVNGSRRGSEDAFSTTSQTRPVSGSVSRLRHATSKTAKGSSLIKKDGCFILTKNGKIITVRRDHDAHLIQRDNTFCSFSEPQARKKNGVSKSLGDINCLHMSPFLRHEPPKHAAPLSKGPLSREQSLPTATTHPTALTKQPHFSLTKTESVGESDLLHETPEFNIRKIIVDRTISSHSNKSLSESDVSIFATEMPKTTSLDIKQSPPTHDGHIPIRGDIPVAVSLYSDKEISNSIDPHSVESPSDSSYQSLAKSDNCLDRHNHKSGSRKERDKLLPKSKSTNIVYKDTFLRGPSLERLDRKCLSVQGSPYSFQGSAHSLNPFNA